MKSLADQDPALDAVTRASDEDAILIDEGGGVIDESIRVDASFRGNVLDDVVNGWELNDTLGRSATIASDVAGVESLHVVLSHSSEWMIAVLYRSAEDYCTTFINKC